MIWNLLRGAPARRIASASELEEFLRSRASLIAQKSVVGYCNVKTMLPLHELMKDKPFEDAFEVSRWEAFSAVLADLVMVTVEYLRPTARDRQEEVASGLVDLYERVLSRHAAPAHRADGWRPDVAAMRARLAGAFDAAPQTISEIAKVSAAHVFDTMPIHQRLREPDRPAIVANVQFLMVGMAHEFEAQLDAPALASEMARGAATA